MKHIQATVFVSLFLVSVAFSQDQPQRFTSAATFEVVTDAGDPVEEATVAMSTFHHWEAGEGFGKDVNETVTGKTNADGIVKLSLPSLKGSVAYRIYDAPGFYRDQGMQHQFNEHTQDRWMPFDPKLPIIFKPILDPVAMYARSVATKLPQSGKAFGYDVTVGDWVAPYGSGKTSDLVFKLTGHWRSHEDYDSTLSISFTNPLDGILEFDAPPPNKGSVFKSPRRAPEGGYMEKEELRRMRKSGQESTEWIDESSLGKNYFFRVRTVADGQGQITSALYGKIYQGFEFAGASEEGSFLKFIYYANPKPNDRNMEFNPAQNLFGELPSDQKVIQP